MVRKFYTRDDQRLPQMLKQQMRSLADIQRPTGTEKDQTVRRLAGTVADMPVTMLDSNATSFFAVTNSWVTRATVTLVVPPDKSTARVLAIGNAEALDDLTGGVTNTKMRLQISGALSREFSASKDAGANKVLNVLAGTHQRVWPVAPGQAITVLLQLYAFNGSAYPSTPQNWAQIAVTANFSN